MKLFFGIPGVTGDAPEVPQPAEGPALFISANGRSHSKTKKSNRQKRSEIYLRSNRRSLPAKQRQ